MKVDFHLHTYYSQDSPTNPKALADKSKRLGVIPAITDHNSIKAHSVMRSFGIDFIPGEEISTDKGDLIGLFISDLIPKKTPFLEALDMIHGQGGLAYLPHMYDYGRSGARISSEDAKKVDIIEIFNARCMDPTYNEKANMFATRNKMLKGVGSDSHFLFEFGSTYNELEDFDLNSPKSFLKSVKGAKFITKKAPFYVRGTTTLVKLSKKIFGQK